MSDKTHTRKVSCVTPKEVIIVTIPAITITIDVSEKKNGRLKLGIAAPQFVEISNPVEVIEAGEPGER